MGRERGGGTREKSVIETSYIVTGTEQFISKLTHLMTANGDQSRRRINFRSF